ncbi:putative urease accessory protein UreF-like protein [Diplogelasinospora grovesii]|uniref:Urease accessory protein UreF-like protein n=1 Tax=Diplogelasinospora grovesii TaxID=303347 RepID=A0AAN6S9V2_9PEZI|nr:putative urease accessory protein UreF-like protein [Diplogelasinospora grovesii]
MISWALKRNSAKDAQGTDDTTQIDLPDTPAPVFAVRALKTALFGTPAPRDRTERKVSNDSKKQAKDDDAADLDPKSPARLPGILLTPGTATARRKRVSFGHDVKEGKDAIALKRHSTGGLPDDSSPFVDNNDEGTGKSRPKTRLTEALENSRKNKNAHQVPGTDAKDFAAASEDAWEETDDDFDDYDYDPDMTVDLNEPHSRSGKYWKSYFESYHSDAKVEMERLVKYKQLAKSYAKKKDAEAVDLNEKLKEEQERVKEMERKVAEMSRQVALRTKKSGGDFDSRMMVEELTKQTALAVEYKKQVEELESILLEDHDEPREKDAGGRRQHHVASPRTQKTILETQRELRRARSQVKELENLKEERDRLKSELKFAEQRATKLADENKKISGDLSETAPKIQDLEKKLEQSTKQLDQKDAELKKLKADYDKLKEDAKARYMEAQQVLHKKNEKISQLQDELKSLKAEKTEKSDAAAPESRWTARAKAFEEKLKASHERLNELRRVSIERGLISPAQAAAAPTEKAKPRERVIRKKLEKAKDTNDYDEALVSSRALRQRIEAEMGKRPHSTVGLPGVLSDIANLQNSRSSSAASAGSAKNQTTTTTTAITTSTNTSRHARAQVATERLSMATNSDKPVRAPVIARPPSRLSESELESPQIDLMQDKFARLGGGGGVGGGGGIGDTSTWSVANTTRTALPADRKAAAIARLQRKRQERLRQEQQQQQQQQQQQFRPPVLLGFHFLLLLSDSALPLGSFAFSSGLESYLAHSKAGLSSSTSPYSFSAFLPVSVSSYASTTLPFVLSAHRSTTATANNICDVLADLDDALDATIVCTVGRRASIAQGRALLSIWERSLSSSPSSSSSSPSISTSGLDGLKSFSTLLKQPPKDDGLPPVFAHLPPLFGAICALVGLSLHQTAYVFLLGHIKALVSAAVRAGMFGPYQAQKTLASRLVQGLITAMIQREWDTEIEKAGQSVPVMDLWFGRHEVLYSRIFNS